MATKDRFVRICEGCGATDESDEISWHEGYCCLLCEYCAQEADDEAALDEERDE